MLQNKEANYTKICEIAKDMFVEWEGKVIKKEDKISLVSNNLLGKKVVQCEVSIGLLDCEKYPFGVDAHEKTYSIIGGCGCPCENEKEVRERVSQMLIRYKFRQKEKIGLFDCDW